MIKVNIYKLKISEVKQMLSTEKEAMIEA